MQNLTIEILDKINHIDDEYERAHWAYLDGFAAFQQGSIDKEELKKLYQARVEALKKSQDYFNQYFMLKEAS